METIKRLKGMVNKSFLYHNEEVVIIGFADGVGEEGEDVEIYLNTGKTIEWKIYDLEVKLSRFRPISNTVIVLANDRLNKVSSVNPTIIGDMRNIILQQIKDVQNDASKVAQAKQVFQGVNTLINLAKTELDYRKYMDKNLPNE
ncbi:MAG: hypothetical protein LBQ73_11055 [Tannerellaceae bacterium]|jgi:ATP-dependent RNA circularization protein (DNA/RNA ligase family)|nr:hypothetical protein [Tannerellaceae bacterium]